MKISMKREKNAFFFLIQKREFITLVLSQFNKCIYIFVCVYMYMRVTHSNTVECTYSVCKQWPLHKFGAFRWMNMVLCVMLFFCLHFYYTFANHIGISIVSICRKNMISLLGPNMSARNFD